MSYHTPNWWKADASNLMKVICSNKILVKNATKDLVSKAYEELVVENPEYIDKVARGKWIGNTPKMIQLFEDLGNGELALPFGCIGYVLKTFYDRKDSVVTSAYGAVRGREYNSSIRLFEYQERVVEQAIKRKNGVIVMPCGSGKTQTALEIAARIGGKCLWLTHTHDLLRQSMERAKACFDMKPEEYGTITEGKIQLGNTITFATVQTMSNLELSGMAYSFDVIIVDECHKCVGTPTQVMMFYKVLSALSARYKYGMTATPERADGMETCMYALLGDKVTEVTRDQVKDRTCPVTVFRVNTDYYPTNREIFDTDGTLIYSSLMSDIVRDTGRNTAIVNVLRDLPEDATCLVLSDRVEHLYTMYEMLDMKDVSIVIDGSRQNKEAKERRREALRRLNSGELRFLFATYKLAKEGLDVPSLKYLVMATPQKDKTTVVQSAGRVSRVAEGKICGRIIDFRDNFGLLMGYARKRDSIYKKMGFDLEKPS